MENDNHFCLVAGYSGSFPDLAFAIGNMAYDRTAQLFEDWARRITQRMDKEGKGLADGLIIAKAKLNHVWDEPYMVSRWEAVAIKHPSFVVGYGGSLVELANALGDMERHRVSLLIGYLAADFARQSASDSQGGRKKLASSLSEIAKCLQKAAS